MLITIIILVLSAVFFERQGSFGYCGTMCADYLTYFSDINS